MTQAAQPDNSNMRTLYNYVGNSYAVPYEKVGALVDSRLPPGSRMYIRCPLCVGLPNRGIHSELSLNGCHVVKEVIG